MGWRGDCNHRPGRGGGGCVDVERLIAIVDNRRGGGRLRSQIGIL